jgi:hypothetical protein
MNPDSAAQQNQSGIKSDLDRYKQAAELAYRYAKTQADEQQVKEESPFEEEDKKEPTQDKETA